MSRVSSQASSILLAGVLAVVLAVVGCAEPGVSWEELERAARKVAEEASMADVRVIRETSGPFVDRYGVPNVLVSGTGATREALVDAAQRAGYAWETDEPQEAMLVDGLLCVIVVESTKAKSRFVVTSGC